MVDEYQDTNHIQERMLELLSSNGSPLYGGRQGNPSIVSTRQTRQIFNEKFQRYAQNPQEGISYSRKISAEVRSAVTNRDVFERLHGPRGRRNQLL